jgi:hypothetical protein
VAPAFQRREHHEYVGHAVALMLVIVPDRFSRLGRDRLARLDDPLFERFIQTHQRTIGVARFLVRFQHILHRRDERRVGVRRSHGATTRRTL